MLLFSFDISFKIVCMGMRVCVCLCLSVNKNEGSSSKAFSLIGNPS